MLGGNKIIANGFNYILNVLKAFTKTTNFIPYR